MRGAGRNFSLNASKLAITLMLTEPLAPLVPLDLHLPGPFVAAVRGVPLHRLRSRKGHRAGSGPEAGAQDEQRGARRSAGDRHGGPVGGSVAGDRWGGAGTEGGKHPAQGQGRERHTGPTATALRGSSLSSRSKWAREVRVVQFSEARCAYGPGLDTLADT